MPMTWTDQADAKLTMAIIATNTVKLDWKAIAEFMGTECTPIAVQRRVQRIKEKAKAKAGDSAPPTDGDANGSGNGEATDTCVSVPLTPEKRKRGRATKNGAPVATGGDEKESAGCNSADPSESPTKKARGQPKGKGMKAIARAEEGASDGGAEEGILMNALVKMEEERAF
ncbi:hypothetical protein BDW75DRAFT_244266 [Aspergillus navahoensis]